MDSENNFNEVKIFIACNKELSEDRKIIRDVILDLNNEFDDFKINNVEFYDIPSGLAKNKTYQTDINEEILKSDIFIVLFHLRYGVFTIQEFEFAKENGKKIFVYFKESLTKDLKEPEILEEYKKIRELYKTLTKNNKILPLEYDNQDKLTN